MNTQPTPAQDPAAPASGAVLTISALAGRTGVSTAVLRTWEARYGFPQPKRLASGHRRYDERDATLVTEVLRRRDAGVRLEVAIAEVAGNAAPAAPSVFATLRRRHPQLQAQALKKSTLLALSRAMEDECCARAERPRLYGAFQHARFFDHSVTRWTDLARTARQATVLADFDAPSVARPPGLRMVHLPASAPLRREWVVICDAPDYPAALAAWEIPGHVGVPDRDRLFEAVWTLEPRPVRDAARTCAALADALDGSGPSSYRPDDTDLPPGASDDLRHATTLFTRLLAYVDK